MKSPMIISVIAAISLGGCSRATDSVTGSSHHGRYAGVGLYPAGRMWEQLVRANTPKDGSAATLKDDEEIIVVLDSNTGELRQCGNLSGHCLSMSTWTKPGAAPPLAPAVLLKHAVQLDQEVEARSVRADINVQAKVMAEPSAKPH